MIKFKLTSDKFRNICICNDWYTRGTCEEYTNMLDYIDKYCTDMCDIDAQDKIEHIASDVLWHSNPHAMCKMSGCTIKEVQDNIAFVLLNACTLSFED